MAIPGWLAVFYFPPYVEAYTDFLLLWFSFLCVSRVEYFLPDFLKTFLTEQNLDSDTFHGQ